MKLLLATLLLASVPAQAVDFSTLYRVYDDGATHVESPHSDLSMKVMQNRGTVSLGYAEDVLSSASSDVKSYGSHGRYTTENKIEDRRQESTATFSMEVEDGQLGWSRINSRENDYESTTYAFAGTREFFQKNTVMFMSFAYGEDRIWASKDSSAIHNMTHETYSLALTQIIDSKSIGQILYDFRNEEGYLSSPYRKARLELACGGQTCVSPVDENHPLTRNRHSLAFKYNHFYSRFQIALANTFRVYFDSWSVLSGTIEERATHKLGNRFDLALNLRLYYQKAASFYEDKYTTLGPFYTGNKSLSTFASADVGLRPTWNMSDHLQLYAKFEYYLINYMNHTDVGNMADPNDDKLLKTQATVYGLGFEGKF